MSLTTSVEIRASRLITSPVRRPRPFPSSPLQPHQPFIHIISFAMTQVNNLTPLRLIKQIV